MFPTELAPAAMLTLVATSIALICRAWFVYRSNVYRAWLVHRSDVYRERARTERQRQALRSTKPEERADILRALRELEPPPDNGD